MSKAVSVSNELGGLESIYLAARGGSAVSDEADQLRRAASDAADAIERSQALFGSKASVIAEIWQLARECTEPGWDGYDAKPVPIEVVGRAVALLRALPANIPMPEVSAEPDGSIALEWHRSRHTVLSLSVGTENGLAYAWLDASDRGHAVAGYDGSRFPVRVLQQIRMIMACEDAPVGTR
jgi:hypothetical protein